MRKHMLWACMAKNVISMICWTILAVIFGKWWIALFAALFMSYVEVKQKHVICDGCGKTTGPADSIEQARIKAASAGWISRKVGDDKWEDYCPDCQKKMAKETAQVKEKLSCSTCNRWSECNGVDADTCLLLNNVKVDRCIYCGTPILEGLQVCNDCEHKQ